MVFRTCVPLLCCSGNGGGRALWEELVEGVQRQQISLLLNRFEIPYECPNLGASPSLDARTRFIWLDCLAIPIAPNRHLSRPMRRYDRASVDDFRHVPCWEYAFVCLGDSRQIGRSGLQRVR